MSIDRVVALGARDDWLFNEREHGGRVNNQDTRHFHEWAPAQNQNDTPTTTYACTSCEHTTTGCTECDRPQQTALTICDHCLNRARRVIQDTIDAIDTIPFHHAEIMGLRAVRYDRAKITGSGDPDRLPFGLDLIIEDPNDTRIEAAKHPTTALEPLHGWATTWAEHRAETIRTDDLQYLVDHTLWAAQNQDASGWVVYLDEAKTVRKTIQRLLGITPEAEPAPCVHCGGTIVREWTTDGLDDVRKCTRCNLTWPNEDRLAYANRSTILALIDTHPDQLVTIDEAKTALPEARRGTLDTWARRGREKPETAKFPTRGRNTRGQDLYRLGDIRDAWHQRGQNTA